MSKIIEQQASSQRTKKEVTYSGVLSLADKVTRGFKDGTSEVSRHLFELAQSCKDSAAFEVGCETAQNQRRENLMNKAEKEGWTKKDLADAKKLPRCYSQAKSNILAMFRAVVDGGFGVSPKEFKSYSELTIRLQELRKQRNGGRTESDGKDDVDTAADVVAKMPTGIQSEFNAILSEVYKQPEKTQREILEAFGEIANTIMYENNPDAGLDDLENAQIEQVQQQQAKAA